MPSVPISSVASALNFGSCRTVISAVLSNSLSLYRNAVQLCASGFRTNLCQFGTRYPASGVFSKRPTVTDGARYLDTVVRSMGYGRGCISFIELRETNLDFIWTPRALP